MSNERSVQETLRGSDDPEYAANLRRATLASSVGSALEYYDFALYGLSTALTSRPARCWRLSCSA